VSLSDITSTETTSPVNVNGITDKTIQGAAEENPSVTPCCHCSSFFIPNMALSMPEMNFGLLMTTIFNMYPLLCRIYVIIFRKGVFCYTISFGVSITSARPSFIRRTASLSSISLLTPMGNDCTMR